MWSGAARSTPINAKTDRKKPSAWRKGNRKTRRSVNAVSIAQSENVFGAPGRPDGDGRHASVASAESHSVTSPRWTKACSYADQCPTRYFVLCFGWTFDLMSRSCTRSGHRGQRADSCLVAAEGLCTNATIRRGDVFQLGRHRLACGDATSATDVARLLAGATPCLMVTDPPYGVNYQPAFRHQAYPRQRTAVGRVNNDTQADWAAAYALFPGDIAYVWHAALFADVVMAGLRQAEFEVRSQIVWAKPTFVLGRGAYHCQHEPAWYAVRQGRGAPWYGGRAQSTVWEVPNLNAIGGSRTGVNAVSAILHGPVAG